MVRMVGVRCRFAIFTACLFAVSGLIIPSYPEAEGKISLASGKDFKKTSTSPKDCTAKPGAPIDDCKSESEQNKIDLDRKGHKVKKSKSRGR